MAVQTNNVAGGTTVQYFTDTSGSKWVEVVASTGISLGISDAGSSSILLKLQQSIVTERRIISDLNSQLVESQAILDDPTASGRLKLSAQRSVAAVTRSIQTSESNILGATSASADISSNYSSVFSTLVAAEAVPAASETAGTKVTDQAVPETPLTTAAATPISAPITDGVASNETSALIAPDEPLTSGEEDNIRTSDNFDTDEVDPIARIAAADTDDASDASSSAETQLKLDVSKTAAVATDEIEIPVPTQNPLHSYATSTYGITLSVLSKLDYMHLVNNPISSTWRPTYTLISSGGGGRDNRSEFFTDDFYFDNLKMTTVIGASSNTRGTNAINITFTVIEPYGLTLLDRIIDVCADPKVNGKNYLQQPYLLEVDFYGSTDLGEMHSKIPELQKRIPIKILELKVKVGARGTEYAMMAIPFGHTALLESTSATPANFEIKASTVGDFFDAISGDNLIEQVAVKNAERDEFKMVTDQMNEAEASGAMDRVNELSQHYSALKKNINSPYSVTSYAGAWNAWQQKAADGKHVGIANQIKFNIHPLFINSPIVDPTKMPYTRSDMPSVGGGRGSQGGPTAAQVAQGNNPTISSATPTNSFDPSKMIFGISSGTSITDIINLVMKNSDYIKSQVTDPLSDKNTLPVDKTVKYFKVTTKVELIDFDELRNEYATLTTFFVWPYEYFNSKVPALPVAKPKGAVKAYNYIYTGKNIDIIEFALDFDTAFYTTVVVNREKTEAVSAAGDAGSGEASADIQRRQPTHNDRVATATTKLVGNEADVSSTGTDTAKTVLVANAMKSIYSGSRGDMLNVKLKILGDPHFIKQDDVYANPGQSNYTGNKTMIVPGALNMDRGEIFCTINFSTPTDMDDATGLLRNDPRYTSAGFSGYYKILTVSSEFSRGQFIQTLDCIRTFDQPALNSTTQRSQKDSDQALVLMNSSRTPSTLTVDDTTLITMNTATSTLLTNQQGSEEEYSTPLALATTQGDDNNSEDTTASSNGLAIASDLQDAPEVDAGDATVAATPGTVNASPSVQTELSQQQINTNYYSTLTEVKSQIGSISTLVTQAIAQQTTLSNRKAILENRLVALDPAVDDMSESQLIAKYPEYGILAAQLTSGRNTIDSGYAQMKSLTASIFPPPANSTASVTIVYETSVYGQTPVIS